jgi:cytochrome P450
MSRPFSIGPRNCIGRHLALVGIYLTLARAIQLFDITADPSMTDKMMKQRDSGILTPWDEKLLLRIKFAGKTAQQIQ